MIIRYLADENIPSVIIKELNEEGFEIKKSIRRNERDT